MNTLEPMEEGDIQGSMDASHALLLWIAGLVLFQSPSEIDPITMAMEGVVPVESTATPTG